MIKVKLIIFGNYLYTLYMWNLYMYNVYFLIYHIKSLHMILYTSNKRTYRYEKEQHDTTCCPNELVKKTVT